MFVTLIDTTTVKNTVAVKMQQMRRCMTVLVTLERLLKMESVWVSIF